jgi:hypothetical protein
MLQDLATSPGTTGLCGEEQHEAKLRRSEANAAAFERDLLVFEIDFQVAHARVGGGEREGESLGGRHLARPVPAGQEPEPLEGEAGQRREDIQEVTIIIRERTLVHPPHDEDAERAHGRRDQRHKRLATGCRTPVSLRAPPKHRRGDRLKQPLLRLLVPAEEARRGSQDRRKPVPHRLWESAGVHNPKTSVGALA